MFFDKCLDVGWMSGMVYCFVFLFYLLVWVFNCLIGVNMVEMFDLSKVKMYFLVYKLGKGGIIVYYFVDFLGFFVLLESEVFLISIIF